MDFSPDFTSRVIYKYVAAGRTHNLMMRGRLGESAVVTVDRTDNAFVQLLADLEDFLPSDLAIISSTYIGEGSSVGFPTTPPPIAPGSNDAATYSKQDSITHFTFQGRTVGGTKSNFKLYAIQVNPDVDPPADESDFRFNPGEDLRIDLAISNLNTSGLPGVDGLVVAWHSFVNIKVNDYWLKKVRAGA